MSKLCGSNLVAYPVGTTAIQFLRNGIRFIKMESNGEFYYWSFDKECWVIMQAVLYNCYDLPKMV